MGRPVTVNIPHTLGKAEAQRRIEGGFDLLQRSMTGGRLNLVAIDKRWDGERLLFEGKVLAQGISGSLSVLEDAVQIQIDLPDLLVAIADRIKAGLTEATKRLLYTGEKGA